ncbi:MAG TPA: LamG-like jellyroll fold domain-containing protein [Conexibacter sp.]|nr:LamG-like jellyroll fold domain-containing protein [Conexibacter sp.]
MRRMSGIVGATVALALLGGSATAGAATLKASYQLHGSRASQLAGAPDLVDVGPGNHFATETVDGVARQVLAFPQGGGVSVRTAGLVDPTSHSVVMVFRLADVSGFRRLLDFSDGASDDGLYDASGTTVFYAGDYVARSTGAVFEDSAYVQVTLTSEATLAGSQWTVVYVNGTPVAAATTTQGFGLGSGVLRLFKDNVSGSGRGEQSAGALACVLVYDGALTTGEVRQGAADPTRCPAPKPTPPRQLGFKAGHYSGTTSQGLPISFTVGQSSVQDVDFRWRAHCADGRVHTNGILLGGGTPIRRGRFSVGGVLDTGGHAHVSGKLSGSTAKGRLSRWGNSAFNTSCPARGVRWHAHLVQGLLSLLSSAIASFPGLSAS